ncbi:MAG: restriction endonuclease subunit S [Bacteroidetes bacterium]|nr:restriction endonuclease subunit S [Bacteroidota bacterium]
MMEWKEICLEDVCLKITDGSHLSPKEFKGGFPMFSVKDMQEFGFDYSNCKTISEIDFNFLIGQGCKPEIDDILIAKDGSVLKHVFRVNQKPDYVLLSSIAILRPKKELVNPDFVVYSIKNPRINSYIISNFVSGTGVPRIVLKDFKKVEILIPHIKEQNIISEILSSLDDKIDLLNRQNKTIEKLSETLFRQWFVEEAEEQSEQQLLLGNLIESVSLTHKFPSEKIVFLNTSDIELGEVLVHEPVDVKSLPGQAKKSIKKNDILFSEIRPANGRYAFVDFDSENYVVSTKLMVLRSKNVLSQAFIYFYLINSQTIEWLQLLAESRSGTFPQITFDQLRDLKVNVPSDSILKETINWCETAIEKIKSNTKQITTLTKLRDTLLPKLMNGEVRINN